MTRPVATPATADAMDDAIDAWHATKPAPCELHEWLHMTWDEYARWAASPLEFSAILAARRAEVTP